MLRFLIGNNSDLDGNVPEQKITDFCSMCEVVKQFKTSAKTSECHLLSFSFDLQEDQNEVTFNKWCLYNTKQLD